MHPIPAVILLAALALPEPVMRSIRAGLRQAEA
jgi:hypothetical protein